MDQLIEGKYDNDFYSPTYNDLNLNLLEAYKLTDDILLKNYISNLTDFEILSLEQEILENNISENVRLFKINEMVYQKDEYAVHKFTSIFNAVQNMGCTVFIMINSDGEKTDIYMGVRSIDSKRTTKSLKDTLKNGLLGQFPGAKIEDLFDDKAKEVLGRIESNSVAIVSCVADSKIEVNTHNDNFLQGLEKLILAMEGKKYTTIILADASNTNELIDIRKNYEEIYTQLSPFANMQIGYGKNKAMSVSKAFSRGTMESNSISNSESFTKGYSITKGSSISSSKSTSVSFGISKEIVKKIEKAFQFSVSASSSRSETKSINESKSESNTIGNSNTSTIGESRNNTETEGTSSGNSNNIQMTIQNKTIVGILQRIDKQLKRLEEGESVGMWGIAAYFLSEDQETSEMGALIYKSIMNGKNSGVEVSAVNFWGRHRIKDVKKIKDYITNFIHPTFLYKAPSGEVPVTATSLVNGNELAIHMGLPRKSINGFTVIEHVEFGKEVVKYNTENNGSKKIQLGHIFNMGYESKSRVNLDRNSLSMHTFITGSTGSGKSNTIYDILDKLNRVNIPFLVIEPAKGEYKNIFGSNSDVKVLGTNPNISEILKINPFKFPKGIHVLEHVDRLVEIFNVCWSMYAAMPAILKDSILKSYESCGWDLYLSENIYSKDIFPTFYDLEEEITNVMKSSYYSDEAKGNYIGSLVTRIKSLNNGLNGEIFSGVEVDNTQLFDKSTIVDLSRVGSSETKSLIMGILIMRLNEHRICYTEGMNLEFRHVTVLEEAHNILKRTSSDQSSEGSNILGKSVELISNSIAEMRTYGEGFIIADQSPNMVDMSAIRNTNTKIVMRLPDESDRNLVGRATGLSEEQISEISKLPKGVAVVYQNDWLESVLCKIDRFAGEEKNFIFNSDPYRKDDNKDFNTEVMRLLFKNNIKELIKIDISKIEEKLPFINIMSKTKVQVKKLVDEYKDTNKLAIWNKKRRIELSNLVANVLRSKNNMEKLILETEVSDITRKMNEYIERETIGLEKNIYINIYNCFMIQNAILGTEHKELYSKWVDSIKKEVVI